MPFAQKFCLAGTSKTKSMPLFSGRDLYFDKPIRCSSGERASSTVILVEPTANSPAVCFAFKAVCCNELGLFVENDWLKAAEL